MQRTKADAAGGQRLVDRLDPQGNGSFGGTTRVKAFNPSQCGPATRR